MIRYFGMFLKWITYYELCRMNFSWIAFLIKEIRSNYFTYSYVTSNYFTSSYFLVQLVMYRILDFLIFENCLENIFEKLFFVFDNNAHIFKTSLETSFLCIEFCNLFYFFFFFLRRLYIFESGEKGGGGGRL